MEIRPIKTEDDYNSAMKRIEELWGVKKDSQEGDELDLLVTLVESYEIKHYPIAPPDPIDAIKFRHNIDPVFMEKRYFTGMN